jgi:hypothetical protein
MNRTIVDVNGITYKVKSKLLKPAKTNGYWRVGLSVNHKINNCYVHRLLAEAFIPNPDNKPEVNHKDGVKTNCTIFNLEWSTYSENNQHAYDTELRNGSLIGRFGIKHPKSKPVIQLDKTGNVLNKFGSACEANRKTHINNSHISCCCRGERMFAGGYVLKFDNNL